MKSSEGIDHERRLRRDLGTLLATAVTVNAMVGTGIFRLAPNVLRMSGSAEAALMAWTVGGLISLCGALCLSELSAAMPRAGGIYEILRRAYGPSFGFWFGWTRLWLLGPSAAGSFARLAAESWSAMTGRQSGDDAWIAIVVLAACTALNLSSVRRASLEQGVLTAVKLAGLVLLGLACLFAARPETTWAAQNAATTSIEGATLTTAFAALVSVMWAYDGWADVSSLAGETKRPDKTLPRAFVVGTALVTLTYLLVNVGYFRMLGEQGVATATRGADMVAMRAAEQALGTSGRQALAFLIFVSCVGACLVGTLTGSRVFVSMASDRMFPKKLGQVSERTGAPNPAVLMTAALAMVYLSFRSFEQLTDAFVLGMFPFYILAVVALPVMRRKEPGLARPFRTPVYPLVLGVFSLGAGLLMWGALSEATPMTYVALGLMFSGLPVGVVAARRARKDRP